MWSLFTQMRPAFETTKILKTALKAVTYYVDHVIPKPAKTTTTTMGSHEKRKYDLHETESAQKRARKHQEKHRQTSRIAIKNHLDRWNELKEQHDLKSHFV